MQLINHGVSEEVIAKMKTDTEEFFGLPLEVKKAYATQPNHIEGYGQAFVFSEEHKLDWVDMLFLLGFLDIHPYFKTCFRINSPLRVWVYFKKPIN